MNEVISRAHADTLDDWARLYQREEKPGASEVGFLLARTAKAIRCMMAGEPIPPAEPMSEPPADEPKAG